MPILYSLLSPAGLVVAVVAVIVIAVAVVVIAAAVVVAAAASQKVVGMGNFYQIYNSNEFKIT